MQRRPIEGGGSMSSSKLWAKIMNPIHQNLEYKKFPKPDGVYMTSINPIDGGRTAYGVMAAFLDGTAPDRYSSGGYFQSTPKTRSSRTSRYGSSTQQQGNQQQQGTTTNRYNGTQQQQGAYGNSQGTTGNAGTVQGQGQSQGQTQGR